MSDVTELLEDLQDARAELARYRRMLALLGAGTIGGMLCFMLSGLLIVADVAEGAVAAVMIPTGALTSLCLVGFMGRVASANEHHYDGRNRHPAERVRAAERRYNKALLNQAEQ